MGLTSITQKVSSSVLSTSASHPASTAPISLATTASEPSPTLEHHEPCTPVSEVESRQSLLQRIFSTTSRKTSQRTSSRRTSQRTSPRPDNSTDHLVNPGTSNGSLHITPSTPVHSRTMLQRIFSTPGRESGLDNNGQGNSKVSLVPPHYTPAFRQREFPLAPYGRGEWGRDLVVIQGNGLRTELRDMYAMFADMEKRPTMLTMEDVDLFVDWFATFLNVLGELFDLEETCLFPWIEGVDTLSHERRMWETDRGRVTGDLSEARRLKRKGYLLRLGKEIEHCADLFERRPVAEGLPALAEAVDKFVKQLMGYIEVRERDLPPIIYKYLRLNDRSRLERIYWGTARSLQHHAFTIVIATNWMGRKQLRRWKRRVLGIFGQGNYGDWKKTFSMDHHSVVKEFSSRVFTAEAERMAQVHENDIARARIQHLAATAPGEYYSDSEAPSAISSSCASSAQRSRNLSTALQAAPACVL